MKVNSNNNVSFNALQVIRPKAISGKASRVLQRVNRFNLILNPAGWRFEYMDFETPTVQRRVEKSLRNAGIEFREVSSQDANYCAYIDDVF